MIEQETIRNFSMDSATFVHSMNAVSRSVSPDMNYLEARNRDLQAHQAAIEYNAEARLQAIEGQNVQRMHEIETQANAEHAKKMQDMDSQALEEHRLCAQSQHQLNNVLATNQQLTSQVQQLTSQVQQLKQRSQSRP